MNAPGRSQGAMPPHDRHLRSIRTHRLRPLAFGVVLLALLIGMAKQDWARANEEPTMLTVRLRPVEGSEVKGRAVLRTQDGLTNIEVLLVSGEEHYAVQIHRGTCSAPEPSVFLPLADAAVNVPSQTSVDLSLSDLLDSDVVIAVLQPAAKLNALLDPESVRACGAIAVGRSRTITPQTGIGVPDSGRAVTISLLTATALATLATGLILRGRAN